MSMERSLKKTLKSVLLILYINMVYVFPSLQVFSSFSKKAECIGNIHCFVDQANVLQNPPSMLADIHGQFVNYTRRVITNLCPVAGRK